MSSSQKLLNCWGHCVPTLGFSVLQSHPQATSAQQEWGQELPIEPVATAEISWSPGSDGTHQEAALTYHILPALGWEP